MLGILAGGGMGLSRCSRQWAHSLLDLDFLEVGGVRRVQHSATSLNG